MKEERHLGSRTLIAQVRAAEEGFEFDFEDRSVRRVGSSSHGGGRIYLGDIVIGLQRAIRSFHAPIVLDVPRFDEQRWVMRLAGERAIVTVTSRAYWGFGLMARCYLNLLEFEGESDDIASATHDLVAMLPHAPWTMVRPRACRRSTGIDPIENERAWRSWVDQGGDLIHRTLHQIEERIARAYGQRAYPPQVEEDLRIARAAGQNSDIGAMERAISRLEASVVIADPSLEGLVDADLPFVDLTSSE